MFTEWFTHLTLSKVLLMIFIALAAFMFLKLSFIEFDGVKLFSMGYRIMAAVLFPLLLIATILFSSLFILSFIGITISTIIVILFLVLFGKAKLKRL